MFTGKTINDIKKEAKKCGWSIDKTPHKTSVKAPGHHND